MKKKLNLLFIEDKKESIEEVLDLLDKDQFHNDVVDFDKAEDRIASSRPDIVILDILDGDISSGLKPIGDKTFKFIWKKHFCPVIIYSARPEHIDSKYMKHPFIKSIQKGEDSEEKVLKALLELRVHVAALQESEDYVRQQFSVAMKVVAPYAFKAFDDPKQIYDTIKRSGRRRLAALMDESISEDTALASWEMYLCPPVGNDIMLGDILKKADGSAGDPSSFRVVLTPSCDMATTGKRKPKVGQILVARCCSMKAGLDTTDIASDMVADKLVKRLCGTVLSQGYYKSIIPFPELKDKIPTMAANLRQLELIHIEKNGKIDKTFSRIASLDSPFRELVSWAYLQVAGRPGLPDRDFNKWAEEIVESIKNDGESDIE